jgi:hypothetical protein
MQNIPNYIILLYYSKFSNTELVIKKSKNTKICITYYNEYMIKTREWKPLESIAWMSKSENTCSRTQLSLRLACIIVIKFNQ